MFSLKSGGALLLLYFSLIAYSSFVSAHNRDGTSAMCENYNPRLDRCGAQTLITSQHTTFHQKKPEQIYAKASMYEGLTENKNRRTIQKLVGVDPVEVPWCAAFVNAILEREGYSRTEDNGVDSFKHYGEKVISPEVGDLVVFSGHVGIFVEYKEINGILHVGVLGGNQSHSVKVSYFPAKKVLTFRRPII